MPVYSAGRPRQAGDPMPAMLAIGDSWFWYPMNNLVDGLVRHPKLRPDYAAIQLFGYNGAHVADYVGKGKYARDFEAELTPDNLQYYSAFLISGGGNDAVSSPDPDTGPNHFGLKDDCADIADPLQCFDELRLSQLQGILSGAIGTLIHDILWAVQRDFKSGARHNDVDVFLHGYDHPVPDGRGALMGPLELAGPWFAKWMNAAKVDSRLAFRKTISDHLIDTMCETLKSFDGSGGGRVHFIDSRNTLNSALSGNQYRQDWANELHPSPGGFAKIVDKAWIPVLRKYNYAT
jgi:hypothetical protein